MLNDWLETRPFFIQDFSAFLTSSTFSEFGYCNLYFGENRDFDFRIVKVIDRGYLDVGDIRNFASEISKIKIDLESLVVMPTLLNWSVYSY